MLILLRESCLLANVIISFGVPLGALFILKRRFGGKMLFFSVGMLTFIVSQILIRIPIISYVLPQFTWYAVMQTNPWLYGIFLGLTASVFEEVGRLIALKSVSNRNNGLIEGISFGFGHGGIEAMLLVGLNSLVLMVLYPIGTIDLSSQSATMILLGGLERVLAMIFHIGASLIVLYGIRVQKQVRFTTYAVLLHLLLDSMIVILPAVFGAGILQLEAYLAVMAIFTLIFGIKLYSMED
ncbi:MULTISPECIES: YhfC family intramembrane metalloprotease [unclassified Fusibacter]|uniref:YhfC family intramembrane metalloprotease n=1 Tax=unclassified Fusibacter TaxID=2624464 RepID=UPI0013E90364|nr:MULTISPECIES: YhfC family glutamic-type intramembrane protease [unclassified Fusibacter]MCK8058155.1 YhfC family intramembrane metalloprotease [Fusibacter sp. A2]NPE20737.1 YhfC family intramembrane metalloprotease [Fusibacter sp. A1]